MVDKCTGDTNLLGMKWNLDRDTLRCNIAFDDRQAVELTKRTMLSMVQQFFDPIGILAASALLPKIWIQNSWKMKLSWDDPLPPDLSKKFRKWLGELSLLKDIEIARYTATNESSELHVFVDACKSSYAACVFIRTVTQCGGANSFTKSQGKSCSYSGHFDCSFGVTSMLHRRQVGFFR